MEEQQNPLTYEIIKAAVVGRNGQRKRSLHTTILILRNSPQ